MNVNHIYENDLTILSEFLFLAVKFMNKYEFGQSNIMFSYFTTILAVLACIVKVLYVYEC